MLAHSLSDFGDNPLSHHHDFKTFFKHLLKGFLPLFGLIVCYHFLSVHAGIKLNVDHWNPQCEKLNQVMIKDGRNLEVASDFTFIPKKDADEPPMLDHLYGSDYVLLYHQEIYYMNYFCSVMYIQYASPVEAQAALSRTEVRWKCAYPVEMRVYDVFLVRVIAPDFLLYDFSTVAFSAIERNLSYPP